jgi:multiple sugar transport system substrate-binding protein
MKAIKVPKPSAVVMVLSFLIVACNNEQIPTPTTVLATPSPTIRTNTPTPTPSPTISPKPVSSIGIDPAQLYGQTLEFWHVWAGEPGTTMHALIEEFNASNEFGILVQPVYAGTYNDLNEKLQTAGVDGLFPDLAIGFNYQILAWGTEQSGVVDLSVYTDDPVWGYNAAEQADFFPSFWDHDQVEGVRFGLPFQRSTYLMFYNASWAEELGFDSPPQTPEEFKKQACAAAKANDANLNIRSGTGGWVTNTAPSAILSWMYAFGSSIVSPAKDGYDFATSEMEDTFVFLKDLYDNGCAWQIEDQYAETEFADRLALFVTASLADLPYVAQAMRNATNEDAWTVLGFPSVEGKPVISAYGPSLAMLSSTKEKQLASWIFMKWLVSPSVQAQWVQATGVFPVRISAIEYLKVYINENPQWAAASELIPHAQAEPHFPSWSIVRWAVSDVGTQTFRYYFTTDRIPGMLKLLDETAVELHISFHE